MNKKIRKLAAVLMFLSIFSLNNVVVFAAPADEGNTEFKEIKAELTKRISKLPLTQCRQALSPLFDIELKEFFGFLEKNFQNKSSNSSLTNAAIARYRDFKKNLDNYFTELNFSYDSEQNTEAIQAANLNYATCVKIKSEYSELAKKILIDHVKTTSAAKKTSVLLEKYQAINSKLRDLNMEISQLYGYFMAFKEKLPGFLQQCINS